MSRWLKVILGDVMMTDIDAILSSELGSVNLAGVYGFGRGLFKRGPMSPIDTTYKAYHRLHAGDFVISTPKAWEGAITRIPEEFDGWFLSPVFPTFKADSNLLDTRYLDWYCKCEFVWSELRFKAKGIGARRESVTAAQFLSLEIPLPSLNEQRVIVDLLDTVAEKVRQIETRLDEIEADAERLLAICFREAIEGAESLTMSEVAPLVRREIEIDIEDSYPELGIRSFGKGTFHKPPLAGSDVGTKRLYRIEPNDLLFSNVFAWEGAIAVVKAKDAGRFGSHRFIACVADPVKTSPEFLHYYFLSPEGLEKIGKASPGGAGRNRTLGLTKLMDLQIPIPSLTKQQAFDKLQSKVAAIKAKHQKTRQELKALLPSMLEQIFTASAKT